MKILGLDALVFGVDDMPAARQFLLDYGLSESGYDPEVGASYLALDQTGLVVRHGSDPSLPPLPPGAHTPCLRETIYGVLDADTLAQVVSELRRDREVRVDEEGAAHCMDDSGFAIAFRVTRRQPYAARYLGFNVPGQPPGREPNDCGANLDEVILPRTLSHVVYFVEDVKRAQTFYERLGFVETDRFTDVGPFMRPGGMLEHHTLFLVQSANAHMVGCNHFTFHLGSACEVMQHGWNFVNKGYKSFWGPGRHVMGSNYFWYFSSPFGALMEIDADMDLHDAHWTPRDMAPGADNSQIFLMTAVPKWAPGA
jgi:catechol 2,3-dioxygenase-like lactoylglutathione lyase family enzyme